MINLKDDILTKFEANVELVNQLDKYQTYDAIYAAIFDKKPPANQDFDTYIIYQLINNTDTFYADNKAKKEYIHYQISVFTKTGSTTSLGNQAVKSMEELGFIRVYIGETHETDTGYDHISTRWKIKVDKLEEAIPNE